MRLKGSSQFSLVRACDARKVWFGLSALRHRKDDACMLMFLLHMITFQHPTSSFLQSLAKIYFDESCAWLLFLASIISCRARTLRRTPPAESPRSRAPTSRSGRCRARAPAESERRAWPPHGANRRELVSDDMLMMGFLVLMVFVGCTVHVVLAFGRGAERGRREYAEGTGREDIGSKGAFALAERRAAPVSGSR